MNNKNVRCSVVRSIRLQTVRSSTAENIERWPADQLDAIFDQYIKIGTLKKQLDFLTVNEVDVIDLI